MRLRAKLLVGIASFVVGLAPAAVSAQTFTPIDDGFDCVRFPDGHQAISRATATGFEVLKPGKVRKPYANESKTIRRRLKRLDDIVLELEDERAKSKVVKFMNKIVTNVFGEAALSETLPDDELELKFQGLRPRLEDRLASNDATLSLIDDCLAGKNLGGGGLPVSPTVTAVSIKGVGSSIYGGWVASTEPLFHENATEPGGYSACVKITEQDGFVRREYSGMDDENRCGIGTLVFDTVLPAECDALIPAGRVGIIKASITITDITGTRTLEELLDEARLYAQAHLPTVTVLAFLTEDLTRDEEIALCNAL